MKSLIEKRVLFLTLFVFIAPYSLYASESISQPSEQVQKDYKAVPIPKRELFVRGYCGYNLPAETYFMITSFVYDNPSKYIKKSLPNDLSEQDLSGFDFTGCQFTYTNLTDTKLDYIILTNTTCDYQKSFQDNLEKNQCKGGNWYKAKICEDLKNIAAVYLKVNDNVHRAKLLRIACGLSRLPFYTDTAFHVKLQYWSCALLHFKQKLGDLYGNDQLLLFSLDDNLNDNVKNQCWTTQYPQDGIDMNGKAPHANFSAYLRNFNDGLIKYQCQSKDSYGFAFYKREIQENIKGLQKAYPNIKSKKLQKEACQIGCALSKSYQIQGLLFLLHYLFYQNRLIRLKNSVEIIIKNHIHIRHTRIWSTLCWTHGTEHQSSSVQLHSRKNIILQGMMPSF